jgi:16S rRNA (cytosine1402-N4)-methyltransferase
MSSLAISDGGRASNSACTPATPIERLPVERDGYHDPVMVNEVLESFADLGPGVIIDATLGGGGHTARILKAYPTLRVLGIDRDPEARARANEVLAPYSGRFVIAAATFDSLQEVVEAHQEWIGDEGIVGVLMDLGVSSHQLDEGSRGFSFRVDAPLDMRMDQTTGQTAAEYITAVEVHDFTKLLRHNGEDRFAGAIARSVIQALPKTTNELSAAVERAVPLAARRKGHVATRVFQALRIEVNNEVAQLEQGLDGALSVLVPGGVLAVISYHSGEDRAVKSVFHEWATGGCRCSYELGCVCGAVPQAIVPRASSQLATQSEIESNPRARSARYRVARKVSS